MNWTFLHADFVHLVWPAIALVATLAWLDVRGRGRLARFVSQTMQAQLAHRATGGRRTLTLLAVLLTCLFGVGALMRPQVIKTETVTSKRVAADIVVLLDVSRSMLAQDAAPTRLERAKAEIRDMIGQLPGNRFGLVAFAGGTTVVSPLTTDYGFFRMSLDAVDTKTVGRGGTRIGDGIRKAISTFPERQGAKILLLITDGEDHESYPVKAAQAALEAGVRIVAIGFGDEKGSEIMVTDTQTGVVGPLRDLNDKVVISRLDGKTLRELAFKTEGVYVPAGVAVLDLETIIAEHVEPLMQESNNASTRTATIELYPWLVLGALVSLFLAAIPASPRRRSQAAAAVLALLLGTGSAHADQASARATYNQALKAMNAGSLDEAGKSFDLARSNAGQDPELRFRVAFNVGLVWAQRAKLPSGDKEKSPEEQVDALEQSAAWFRDAIRLRPKDKDARVNLEIVLLRIQALADEINKGKNGLEPRVDRLIEDQRRLRDGVRQLMAKVAAANAKSDPEMFREEFREVAQLERQLLAEAGTVFDMAASEMDPLAATPEEERTDEQRGRMFQLQSFSSYLEAARQAMADTRQRLRRLDGDRAHEQSNRALATLKRAREQLQDPVRVLRGLLQDEARLQAESRGLEKLRKGNAQVPKWLTVVHLGLRQRSLHERSGELLARLQAGVSRQPADDISTDPEAAKRAKLLATVRLALPHIDAATTAMSTAGDGLDNDRLAVADEQQTQVLEQLALAIEQFSDLRGLIELAYSDQQRAKKVLTPTEGTDALSPKQQAEFLIEVIGRNRSRLERLAGMFADKVQELEQAPPAGQQPPSQEDIAQQKALYAQAENERVAALDALARMETSMRRFGQTAAARRVTGTANDETLERIESLRRLFFSVVEHLQELGRDQANTMDSTASSQALPTLEATAAALGPLVGAQAGHVQKSDAIAQALEKQADQAAGQPAQPGQPGQPGQQQQQQALAEAAKEVNAATSAMKDAHASLTQVAKDALAMSTDIEPTIGSQKSALEHIAKAIALLQPPDDKKKDQDQQDDSQEEQSREQAARRLQEIRDREAQRRRDRRRRPQKSQPVEKDW